MEDTFLRPVRGNAQPRHWFTIACSNGWSEGDGQRTVRIPYLQEWVCVETIVQRSGNVTRREFRGTDPHEFWAQLRWRTRSGGLAWVFCLDAGLTLPLLGTFQELEKGGLVLWGKDARAKDCAPNQEAKAWHGYAVIEDPPTILSVRPHEGPQTYRLVDLRNYGIEQWSDLDDTSPVPVCLDPEQTATADERVAFVALRAAAIAETVDRIVRLLSENELGGLQTTASSQAMYTFRRAFLSAPIFLHRDPSALALERQAYYGGRCEVHQIGKVSGPVYHLDFTSFYPSCCVGMPLPVCFVGHRDRVDLDELPVLLFRHMCCAEVTIETDKPVYPVRLPGRVVWPVGSFRTFLAGPELIHAFDAGRIKGVWQMSLYDGKDVLSQYSRVLFECRRLCHRTHGRATTLLLKRMLNALPGKFGQQGRRWINHPGVKAVAPYMNWYAPSEVGESQRWRSIAWMTQEERIEGETGTSCPAISAWVTSQARINLWRATEIAGHNQVWYTDTDSIHCSAVGYDRLCAAGLVDGNTMGKLRVVEVAADAEYKALKHYLIGGRLVCSGMVSQQRQHLTDDYMAYSQEKLRDGLVGKRRPEGRQVPSLAGTIQTYQHGRIGANGRVYPLKLNRSK